MAPFGPGRDDRIEAVAARAALAHRELERERELVLGDASARRGSSDWNASSAIAHARADAVDLAVVLHPAQLLDERARGHELDARERGRELALLRPRDAVLLEPEPRARSATAATSSSRCAAPVRPISMLRVDAGGVELLVRLLGVAAVGDEQRVVGA